MEIKQLFKKFVFSVKYNEIKKVVLNDKITFLLNTTNSQGLCINTYIITCLV